MVPRFKRTSTDIFIQIACPLEMLPLFARLQFDLAVRLSADFEGRRLEFGMLDRVVVQSGILVYGG